MTAEPAHASRDDLHPLLRALFRDLPQTEGLHLTLTWNPGPGRDGLRLDARTSDVRPGRPVRSLPSENLTLSLPYTGPQHSTPGSPAELNLTFIRHGMLSGTINVPVDTARTLAHALRAVEQLSGEVTFTRQFEPLTVTYGQRQGQVVMLQRTCHDTWTVWKPARSRTCGLRFRRELTNDDQGAPSTKTRQVLSGRIDPPTHAELTARLDHYQDTHAQGEHPAMTQLIERFAAHLRTLDTRLVAGGGAQAGLFRGPYRTGVVHAGHSVVASTTEPAPPDPHPDVFSDLHIDLKRTELHLNGQAGQAITLPAETCLLVLEAWPAWNAVMEDARDRPGTTPLRGSDRLAERSSVWSTGPARDATLEWSVLCRPEHGELICSSRLIGPPKSGSSVLNGLLPLPDAPGQRVNISIPRSSHAAFIRAANTLKRHYLMNVLAPERP